MYTHVGSRGRRQSAAGGEHVGFVKRCRVTCLSRGGVPQCGDPGIALCTIACDESPRSLAGQTKQQRAIVLGRRAKGKSIRIYLGIEKTRYCFNATTTVAEGEIAGV